MKSKVERRAYKRISIKDVSFSCYVEAGDDSLCLCNVTNLSLSGSYLECPNQLTEGDICEVIFTSQDDFFSTPLDLSARVVRIDEKGAALKFYDTNDREYMMLQTILLYHFDEPHILAIEFPATSPLEIRL